ncbi:hypothetical protein QUA43_20725 [Microcoleus sp. N9_B4]|uniref:hypothetical protein n=1 Tax=Microcoleus sp. N9_B4 TaxID=3055386 RepID=UPI002FD42F78
MDWSKQSEADGRDECEAQSSTGEGKEAECISLAVFNCAGLLVRDDCFFLGNSGEVDRTIVEIY